MLHCVGAPRGPAKKFCLSAFGFWDFTVDRVGLSPGMLGGVPEKLRTEKWLRLAPGHEPSTKQKWLRAVHLLFQVPHPPLPSPALLSSSPPLISPAIALLPQAPPLLAGDHSF